MASESRETDMYWGNCNTKKGKKRTGIHI